ncbi:MAG: ABC transporter ATP-binding protein [Anaerolineae bacterium]|nr:ABC transporter ATP-binding protein [Anaerolineae bacterium]
MNATQSIIQTHTLTKSYGAITALRDLSLEVHKGEVFGYLGPNGAGKTTTIRLLLDMIRASAGSASLFGMDSRQDSIAIRKRTGYLPGELALWENLTGWGLVEYFERLRGVRCRDKAGELAERLDIDLSRKIHGLSTGMKRKVGLIQALMHEPELLILDEPTGGLDPLVQQTFYHIVDEVREAGQTVFLSSHNLPEVERVCDRVGILREGVLSAVEQVGDLKHASFRWMTLQLGNGSAQAATQQLKQISGVEDVSIVNNGGAVRFRVSGKLDPVIKVAANYEVLDLAYEEPSLEEIFLTFYGGD